MENESNIKESKVFENILSQLLRIADSLEKIQKLEKRKFDNELYGTE